MDEINVDVTEYPDDIRVAWNKFCRYIREDWGKDAKIKRTVNGLTSATHLIANANSLDEAMTKAGFSADFRKKAQERLINPPAKSKASYLTDKELEILKAHDIVQKRVQNNTSIKEKTEEVIFKGNADDDSYISDDSLYNNYNYDIDMSVDNGEEKKDAPDIKTGADDKADMPDMSEEDNKHVNVIPEAEKAAEVKVEDIKTENIKPEEKKVENIKPDEKKADKIKPEDVKHKNTTNKEALLERGEFRNRVYGGHGGYLDKIDNALNATASKLSNDSTEYKELCTALKDTCAAYYGYDTNINNFGEYKEKMWQLRTKAEAYINHCEQNKKSGSRRAERLKNANRIMCVCNAFEENMTVKDYLVDNIALKYYATIIVSHSFTLKKDEAAEYKNKYIGNNDEAEKFKHIGANYVKEFKPFKKIVSDTDDINKLFSMNEEPVKTFNRINKSATGKSKQQLADYKDLLTKGKDLHR